MISRRASMPSSVKATISAPSRSWIDNIPSSRSSRSDKLHRRLSFSDDPSGTLCCEDVADRRHAQAANGPISVNRRRRLTLERIDGEFHREQADQLGNLARELRGVPQNG